MSIKKVVILASACIMSVTASAQQKNAGTLRMKSAFESNMYNRPLGLNNFKHLGDEQLQQIGSRVSACGFPTKAEAKKLLKNALAGKSAMRKAAKAEVMKAKYVAQDTLFWDSFEGWDGTTMPWLPTENRWSTKSNISNLNQYLATGSCPTWTGYAGDGYYVPYAFEGKNMLVCMFGGEIMDSDGTTVVTPAPEQDEWLVSPQISAIDGTNYLSFDICYSPWNTHFFIEDGEDKFDLSRTSYEVEVMIAAGGRTASYNEADYDVVYSLTEEVDKQIAGVNMDDDEELSQLMYMNWHHVQIPLTDYDGKNIRVAFRYKGTKGGSIMIDAVRVSDLLPVAKFDVPEGAFYWGFSENAMLFQNFKMGLIPAYVPTTWKNYSNVDSKDFAWSYLLNDEAASATGKNLEMPAQQSSHLLDMPKLTAMSGARSDLLEGGFFKVGGNAVYAAEGMSENFYVGNYDPTKGFWLGKIGSGVGGNAYAFGTGSGSFYGQMSNYRYNAVDGIGNFYDAPSAPYVFNSVLLPLGEFFSFGATLACTIYKVKDGNTITDEVIAQATLKEGTQISGGWFLVFNFAEPVVVDDAIFIMIDGFDNSNILDLAPLSQALNHDSEKSYAFLKLKTSEGSFAVIDVMNLLAGVEGGNMTVSHCIGMNAVFPYLHSMDGDVFLAPAEGGNEEYRVDSYWAPKDWTVSCSDKWFRATTEVDDATQTVKVKVEADALPAGLTGRNGEIRLEALGCSQVISVLQGDAQTAISGIAENRNVSMDGTYLLSGQRVNEASAKRGMYIVKKNGKYVKVVK